jgi:hypothetical protein
METQTGVNEMPKVLRGVDWAADCIQSVKKNTKQKAARIAIAKAAITIGNYTEEAKDLWRAYLDEIDPPRA